MCLNIDYTYHPKTKRYSKVPYGNKYRLRKFLVAGYDILCYKFFQNIERNGEVKLVSPFRYMEYEIGKLYTANLRRSCENVEVGLHAFMHEATAKSRTRFWDNEVVRPCVIPKGSKFYIGTDDDIVSDALIVYDSVPKHLIKNGDIKKHTEA